MTTSKESKAYKSAMTRARKMARALATDAALDYRDANSLSYGPSGQPTMPTAGPVPHGRRA